MISSTRGEGSLSSPSLPEIPLSPLRFRRTPTRDFAAASVGPAEPVVLQVREDLVLLDVPPMPRFFTIVLGRSKTAIKGRPPKATKWRARLRTIVSTRSLSTSVTEPRR
jgi:hypothetical protein